MKNPITLILLLAANLSFGQIMMLFEVETPNKDNMESVAENWFGAVKSITGDDNGITMHDKGWASKSVYFVQWYDDLKDMVETMKNQESKSVKVMEYIQSKPSDPELLNVFNSITDPKQSSVWEYVPELSMMDDFFKLSESERDQMQYRRFQYIDVAMNAGQDFEMHRKKANSLSKKIGVKYHIAVFRNVFGGKDSDYLTILIDSNRLDYMKNFTDRMSIRRNSPDWGNNNNPWDLSKFSVIKTEEISKNLAFKILDN
jgi:hypothetical protein|tara:strand:+ start:40 stop:813 length:774 start_codon:yes stop_codon:yes gene_type:complete